MTDEEILARAARGDRAAFGNLYERHWKAVYRYAWLLARSVADAEDVTQECFLALIRRPKSFDPARAKLRTWLLAVARNQMLQRCRIPQSQAAEEEESGEMGESVEEELMTQARADAVRRAVDLLPGLQREALFLFEFEGLSLAETAVILNIEPNAVKARLFRARERLKRLLDPQRAALSWKREDADE
jgi:RNA polymerase sigma-70 factor (ECF subfamily)